MPPTLTEATPKGKKWDIKKQVTFESIYTSGKRSSEAVRSCEGYSLTGILCCLHLFERQEEPQQNFHNVGLLSSRQNLPSNKQTKKTLLCSVLFCF